jgi:hypothetical protein
MKDRFKLIDYNGNQGQSFKPNATTSDWKSRTNGHSKGVGPNIV